jgi:hypothetical protein
MLFLLFLNKKYERKIEDGLWNKDNADGPNVSIPAGLDQQSMRRLESLQPQKSHESLWAQPSD